MRTVLVGGLVVVAAGCGGDGSADRDADCNVGAREPSAIHHRAILLACGEVPDGRRIRIAAGRDAAGACLEIIGLPGGTRACGRAPSDGIASAIQGPAIVRRTPKSRLEVYGEARAAVRRVDVRFRTPNRGRRQLQAALIRVEDRAALRAARIRKPFGYFVGFVPGETREVVATGRDADGGSVGRLRYDGVVDSLHPTVFIAQPTRSTNR